MCWGLRDDVARTCARMLRGVSRARGARLNGGRVEAGLRRWPRVEAGESVQPELQQECGESQALIARTRQRLHAALTRRLEDVEPLAPFVDAARVSRPRSGGPEEEQPQCHAELTADVARRGNATVRSFGRRWMKP